MRDDAEVKDSLNLILESDLVKIALPNNMPMSLRNRTAGVPVIVNAIARPPRPGPGETHYVATNAVARLRAVPQRSWLRVRSGLQSWRDAQPMVREVSWDRAKSASVWKPFSRRPIRGLTWWRSPGPWWWTVT